ncbi:hypothetical protein K474DRAFT_1604653 [Panus rudis PR-1116 ss-1]|nr:hypothetical protein K474DRAFT_1604653 [Panus rudis PR-1116 ss-1]
MSEPTGNAGPSNGGGSGSGSGTPAPTTNPSIPKVVPSLAKKQSDVTRLGTQKLKFVPTLPARRVKEEVKKEPATPSTPNTSERGRGRGRGRGGERGGRGRGGGTRGGPPSAAEMTASGPFAMGPALAGTSARRTAPRSNVTPIIPQGPGAASKIGAGLVPVVKKEDEGGAAALLERLKEKEREREKERGGEDEEMVYSDPDEGVEIVDMEKVRNMDWMAPESLRKEKDAGKKKKKVKKEEEKKTDVKGKGVSIEDAMEVDNSRETTVSAPEEVNLANAVDLSESEDDEELEDIVGDFALPPEDLEEQDFNTRQERLYFFQFPDPFPTFISHRQPPPESPSAPNPDGASNLEDPSGSIPASGKKAVSFADDTKPPAPGAPSTTGQAETTKTKDGEKKKMEGVIGQLEVYASGAVKMRMGNGIVLDVAGATQPSFLQQAVYLDPENKRLCVLGEVNRRFVVSPDLDALLSALEIAERPQQQSDDVMQLGLDGAELISMDTT